MAEQLTKEQYVEQELKARKLKNTPANRKILKLEWDNKYLGGDSRDWKSYFKRQFPVFAEALDGAQGELDARATFGDDLIDLFYDAAQHPEKYDFQTEAGKTAWLNNVQSKSFYNTVLPNQRAWAIIPKIQQLDLLEIETKRVQALYAEFAFTPAELADIALYNLKVKPSELQSKYHAYSILQDRKTTSGTKIGDTTAAQDIKTTMDRYNFNPPGLDEQINAALTGRPLNGTVYTPEMLIKKAKDGAKTMYSHYTPQIDGGYTLEDIFDGYRNLAADTLEINANSINMKDPKWRKALELVDEKGMALSGTNWVRYLKSDPDYGYSKTAAANKEVSSIVQTLEAAFGKVQR